MPVAPASLIYPVGEIRPEWFSDDVFPVVAAAAASAGDEAVAVEPLSFPVAAGAVLDFGGATVVPVAASGAGAASLTVAPLAAAVAAGASATAPLPLASSLAVRIAAGVALVPPGASPGQGDAVVAAYAYRETYGAKVLAMAASPDSVGLGDLSVTNSAARIRFFEAARDRWALALADAVSAATPAPVVSTPPPRLTTSVPSIRNW